MTIQLANHVCVLATITVKSTEYWTVEPPNKETRRAHDPGDVVLGSWVFILQS